MGFGLLFAGYTCMFLFRLIPILEICGFGFMIAGLYKLSIQNNYFKYALFPAIFMFLYSIFSSVLWILKIQKIQVGFSSSQLFISADNVIYHMGLFILHILLYLAINKICTEVDYKKGISKSKFLTVSVFIYYFTSTVVGFLPDSFSFLALPVMIFGLVWIILSAVLIYGCYMNIVTQQMIEKENVKILKFEKFFAKKK